MILSLYVVFTTCSRMKLLKENSKGFSDSAQWRAIKIEKTNYCFSADHVKNTEELL